MLALPLHVRRVNGQNLEEFLTIGRGRDDLLLFALSQLLQFCLHLESEPPTADPCVVGELQWSARAQVLRSPAAAAAMIFEPPLDIGCYPCVERAFGGANEIEVPVLHTVAVRRLFARDYRTSNPCSR